MALYIYQHPETGEIKEIVQSMTEPHIYEESGVKWGRVFTNPNPAIDTKIDAFSKSEFLNKTANKKGTLGGIMDLSSELSQKRAEKTGQPDAVREQYYKDYSTTRKGVDHPDVRKRKLKETLKKSGQFDLT